MLLRFLKEQWWLLVIGFPFMFLGSIGEFITPYYIGQVIEAMREKDRELVNAKVLEWILILLVGAAC